MFKGVTMANVKMQNAKKDINILRRFFIGAAKIPLYGISITL